MARGPIERLRSQEERAAFDVGRRAEVAARGGVFRHVQPVEEEVRRGLRGWRNLGANLRIARCLPPRDDDHRVRRPVHPLPVDGGIPVPNSLLSALVFFFNILCLFHTTFQPNKGIHVVF